MAVGGRAQTGTREIRGVAGVTNSLRVEESPLGGVDCTARGFSVFLVLLSVDLAGYCNAVLCACESFDLVTLDSLIRATGLSMSGLGVTSRLLGVGLVRWTAGFLSYFMT